MEWKLSGLLADVNGKFGGSTVFQGRTGLIMRNVRKGKNPRSTTQIQRRGQFKFASQRWRDLTEVQIESWKQAAKQIGHKTKVGASYHSSGSALYSAVNDSGSYANVCALLGGYVPPVVLPIDDVPSLDNPTPLLPIKNIIAKNVGGAQTLTIEVPQVAGLDLMIIEATPQMSAGRSFFKGQFRPITSFDTTAIPGVTSLLTKYQAVFGDLVAGQKMCVRSRYYNKIGQASLSKTGEVELSVRIKAI